MKCAACQTTKFNFPGDSFIVGSPREFLICWKCFEEIRDCLPWMKTFRKADEFSLQYPRMVIEEA